jgi:glucokinase
MSCYIALDIGGTKLMVASATPEGKIIERVQAETPRDLTEGLETLHRMIATVAKKQTILAIGATAGGPLDYRTGVVSPLHQPEWRDVPLKQIMEQRWDCKFAVDVDTNVAALGEYALGGEKVSRLLYVTLSTGMGGGFVIDGELYRGGMGGVHPEVGHQAIAYRCMYPERIHCDCGAPDCLEGLISGSAIRRIYGKPAQELNQAEWAEVGYNLGQGLRNMAMIYAPDVIALGGGVCVGGGETLLATAREVMEQHMRLVPVPTLRISKLGYDTPLLGAIVLAQSLVN